MPDEVKKEISAIVRGETVDTLEFGGLKKKLLCVTGNVFRQVFAKKQTVSV